MNIPFLTTERLELVPPNLDAFEVYSQFYSDEEASKMYGGPLPKEHIWARLKADIGSWYLLGFGVWIVKENESGNFAGACGFWKGCDWPTELTWWLIPSARSKGYAVEASKAAIGFAHNQWQWHSVETYMNDENVAARKLVLKLGGIQNGRRKFPDGLERDVYTFPRNA
tara:strand:+ start:65 stop:571 length:507 start_codon:yes stop_codon:yes gene_type:complete